MTRRRFVFWLGFGLFTIGAKLRIDGLDKLAAAMMRRTERMLPSKPPAVPEHWSVAGDQVWRWFEREHFVDGVWKFTGTTTPIHNETGERSASDAEYLDDSLVPTEMRRGRGLAHFAESSQQDVPVPLSEAELKDDFSHHHPSAVRIARHGRPPSKWLRSLHADEIRIFLKTIEVPEADVSGMTFWEHLTRDHSFDADHIAGLTEPEQAKLHAAAHAGY